MKNILLFSLLWFCAVQVSEACSCYGNSDFMTSVTNEDYPPDLVVRGVKTADHYYGMKFRIKEVLQGQTSLSSITVWGDNGALCRVYTSGFAKGEELILALYKTDGMGNSITAPEYPKNLEKEGDFQLSICGVHFLKVENNKVNGPISEGKSTMTYTAFRNLFNIDQPTPPEDKAFLVYPNPAPFGNFKVAYQLSDIDELNISLYNVIGNKVKDFQVPLLSRNGTIEIDAPDISKGIYFLDIQAKGYRYQQKILVM